MTRQRRVRIGFDGGRIAAAMILLAVSAPFGFLVAAAAPGSPELWSHLARYVLPAATVDTIALLLGVGSVTGLLGVGLAWLVSTYEFPLRRLLDACLVLPLAVPSYIIAYAYLDLLHPIGPVQETIRTMLGYSSPREFRLPDIRSLAGCIVVLGFVLYPYVYLPTRALFAMQSASLLEAARTLGLSRVQTMTRVGIPLARPAIALGLALALMETLNDIGASEFMGIRTLTVSIYSTWVTRGDLPGAAQIAIGLLIVVIGMVAIERWARRRQRFVNDAQHPRPMARIRVSPLAGWVTTAVVIMPIVVGFVLPFAHLAVTSVERVRVFGIHRDLFRALAATLTLSVVASIAVVVCGIVVAYAARLLKSRFAAAVVNIASVGYATPGTVVAIGLLPIVTGLDRMTGDAASILWTSAAPPLVMGTGIAIVYAYLVRFLAVSVGGVESALAKVPFSLDEAAATLGASKFQRLWHVKLPLLQQSLIATSILVFIDCMKELPATLLLRPLGVETLSTLLYGEAARGTYENGAIAALLIVLAGVVPVVALGGLVSRGT